MNKVAEDSIVFTNYRRYLEIAQEAKNKALESAHKRNELVALRSDDYKSIGSYGEKVHKEATICVVFSAMTLEAFINEYGIDSSSSSFFKNYLDKLDLLSKFLLIPQLYKTKLIDTNSHVFENLKWLINVRNDLIHFKKRSKKIKDFDMTESIKLKDFMMESHAEKAVMTVHSILELFNKKTS